MTQPQTDRYETLAAEARKTHRSAKEKARSIVGSEFAYHLANQGLNLPGRLYFTAANPPVGGPMSAVASTVEVVTDHLGYRAMLGAETAIHERDLNAQANLAKIANTLMMASEGADRLMRARIGQPEPEPAPARFVPDPAAAAGAAARSHQAREQAREFLGSETRAQALGQLFQVPAHLVNIALNPVAAAPGIAVRAVGTAAAEHTGYQRTLDQLTRAAAGDLDNHVVADTIGSHAGRLADKVRGLGGGQGPLPVHRPAGTRGDAAQAAEEVKPPLWNRITGLSTSSLVHDLPARAVGVAIELATLGVAAAVNTAASAAAVSVTQFGLDVAAGFKSTARRAWIRAGDIGVDNRVADLAQRVSALSGEVDQLGGAPSAPAPSLAEARAALRPTPGRQW